MLNVRIFLPPPSRRTHELRFTLTCHHSTDAADTLIVHEHPQSAYSATCGEGFRHGKTCDEEISRVIDGHGRAE